MRLRVLLKTLGGVLAQYERGDRLFHRSGRYTRVPQETTGYDRTGRLVTTTVYVKVPSGKLTVNFENSLVTALDQTEGTTDVQVAPRIIPAPILVAF